MNPVFKILVRTLGLKAIVWTENEKIVYPNLHVYRKWWLFSSVSQEFATFRSSPAHFNGKLRWGIKLNQFYYTIAWVDVS